MSAMIITRKGTDNTVGQRRLWFQKWYASLGFNVEVPMPQNMTSDDHAKLRRREEELFFRPSIIQMSYEGFMITVDEAAHWTVNTQRVAIPEWNPAMHGYWFHANISTIPRKYNIMGNGNGRLLYLEEYAIMFFACRRSGIALDINSTRTWLHTKFYIDPNINGSLTASGENGRMQVFYGSVNHGARGGMTGGRMCTMHKE